MKISVIIIFALVLIGVFIYRFFRQSGNMATSIGSMDDLESHIEKLMKSTMTGAFLIVKVYSTSDFTQFSGSEKNVQLDFPLVTDRQKSMEAAFTSAATELKLQVMKNRGSSGDNFLDIDVGGTATDISIIAKALMTKLFGVNRATQIEYELNAWAQKK